MSELETSWEATVTDQTNASMRVAYGITKNVHDAEDIAQETLIRSWKHRQDIKGKEARFARKVAANLAVDAWRRNRNGTAQPLDAVPELRSNTAIPDSFAEANEVTRAVQEAIGKVKPRYLGDVIRRHWIDEVPVSELASELNLPIGTIKSRLSRGYSQLRVILKPMQPD